MILKKKCILKHRTLYMMSAMMINDINSSWSTNLMNLYDSFIHDNCSPLSMLSFISWTLAAPTGRSSNLIVMALVRYRNVPIRHYSSFNPAVAAETKVLDKLGQYCGCCFPDYMSSAPVVFGLQNNRALSSTGKDFKTSHHLIVDFVIDDANYLSVCYLK